MNVNFPEKQLQIVDILEQKYSIDSSLISRMYLPHFIEEAKADYILKETLEFEKQTNNLSDAKTKITEFFELIIAQNFLNNI